MHGDDDDAAALGAAFWRFSLDLYGAPDAPETCLALQDRFGVDVNLALFCLWSGLGRGRVAAARLGALAALADAWRRRAVAPLRAIRRDLKTGVAEAGAETLDVEHFRAAVKALELEAERRQQIAMAAFAAETIAPASPEAARAHFRALYPDMAAGGAALFETLLALAAARVDLGDRAP